MDPVRDIEIIETEILLSDLESLHKRLEKNNKKKLEKDEISFLEECVELINSEKKTIDGLEIGKDITNTPTIIFLKNSNEENRIVEFPFENLENDIFKIINDMGYKNVYFSE